MRTTRFVLNVVGTALTFAGAACLTIGLCLYDWAGKSEEE